MTSFRHIFTLLALLGLIHTQDTFIRVYLEKTSTSVHSGSKDFLYSKNQDSIKDPSIPDTHFIAQLGIGSQDQPFLLALQTSLNYLVVGGPDSIFNNKFDCIDSSTCEMDNNNTTTLEGATYCANGSIAHDQLILQSQSILNQSIFVINSSEGLEYTQFDGILGLGFDFEDDAYRVHILNSLRANNLIMNESFSIFLGTSEGVRAGCLILGGYDDRFNSTEFTYMNLTRQDAWTVRVLNGSIGDAALEIPYDSEVYFESGTIGFLFPEKIGTAIKDAISKEVPCSYESNKMLCECSGGQKFPSLNLTFEGLEISLGPEDYLVHDGETCSIYIGLSKSDSKTLILGDVFMKKYYTHYDSDNKRIGLAIADQQAYFQLTVEFSSLFYVAIFVAGCLLLILGGYLAFLRTIAKKEIVHPEVFLTQETKIDEPVAQLNVE